MSNVSHDGIIDDDRVYTTEALATLLGYSKAESAERCCRTIGCRVKRVGRRAFVSGHEFRLALERFEPSDDIEVGKTDSEI